MFGSLHVIISPDCPPGPNPDADFGEAPMLLTVEINATKRDIAVATQKSGFTWALDRDTGNQVWSTVCLLHHMLHYFLSTSSYTPNFKISPRNSLVHLNSLGIVPYYCHFILLFFIRHRLNLHK